MIYRSAPADDDWLTEGVIRRRLAAWCIDVVLVGLLWAALWFVLLLLGLLTLGLSMPLLGALPFVPFCYVALSIAGRSSATPGQQLLGLIVRRNDDLERPTPMQAVIFAAVYCVTMATTGLLLLIALFTVRRRTLHDIASGLVVVHAGALTGGFGSWNMRGGSPYA